MLLTQLPSMQLHFKLSYKLIIATFEGSVSWSLTFNSDSDVVSESEHCCTATCGKHVIHEICLLRCAEVVALVKAEACYRLQNGQLSM